MLKFRGRGWVGFGNRGSGEHGAWSHGAYGIISGPEGFAYLVGLRLC